MDKYLEILKKNNLKITHQRLSILKYLDNHRTHPTAEEIYSALKKKYPSLSKTTVYNSLEILKKYDIIHNLTISGTETRYDFKTNNHHHFYCKKCGQIFDIEIECPNMEKPAEYGHIVDEVHGYFKGTCKYCIEKEKRKK